MKTIKLVFNRSHFEEIFDIEPNPLDVVNNLKTRDIFLIILICILCILSGILLVFGIAWAIWYSLKIFRTYQTWKTTKQIIDNYLNDLEKYKNIYLEFENHILTWKLDDEIFVFDLHLTKKIYKSDVYLKVHFNTEHDTLTLPKKSVTEEDYEYIYNTISKYMKEKQEVKTTFGE